MEFSLNYEVENLYYNLVEEIKKYFGDHGLQRAVLGLSGGLDSTICAVLLADALGKENVVGVSMPSKITSANNKDDAKELAQNLGIHFLEIPIKEMYDASLSTFEKAFLSLEKSFSKRLEKSFTKDNIQARARAMILWGISNEFSSTVPIATCDKSEIYMGYATVNGDMSGGFSPICEVTKTKLFALGEWMNKNRDNKISIPVAILKKSPSAELAIDEATGKPLLAEDALMPYEFLDEVIWYFENFDYNISDLNSIKFLYEKNHDITSEQKKLWLEKFIKRIKGAFFKWTFAPEGAQADNKTLCKKCFVEKIIPRLK